MTLKYVKDDLQVLLNYKDFLKLETPLYRTEDCTGVLQHIYYIQFNTPNVFNLVCLYNRL